MCQFSNFALRSLDIQGLRSRMCLGRPLYHGSCEIYCGWTRIYSNHFLGLDALILDFCSPYLTRDRSAIQEMLNEATLLCSIYLNIYLFRPGL